MRQNIVYRMTCVRCKEDDRTSCYIGESFRTSYDWGLEHLNAMRTGDTNSPLVEHNNLEHQGEEPRFSMEIIARCKSSLQRQVEEGDQILRHEKYNLLNRRGEWGQNLPPKLGVEEQVI